jgi:hypothetical protein
MPTSITSSGITFDDATTLTTGVLPTANIANAAVTNNKLSLAANAGEIKKALNADNSPPIYACRAWVNFDGTAGSTVDGEFRCTIRASGNVSKVVRGDTGNYTISFTTAMPDANYCLQTTTSGDGVAASFVYEGNGAANRNTAAVSSVIIQVVSQAGTPANRASNSVAIFR